jgi:hypothetical protein
VQSDAYRSSAAIEIATGKAAKKKSKWSALSQGLMGFGSIAMMGADAGLFSGSGKVGGSVYRGGSAGFGSTPTHLGTFYA